MLDIEFVYDGGLGNQIFQYLASRKISKTFKNLNLHYSLSKHILNGSRNFELNKILIKPVKVESENIQYNDENISKIINKIPLLKNNHKKIIKFKLNALNNLYFEDTEDSNFNDPISKLIQDLNKIKFQKRKFKIYGFWQNPSSYLINLQDYRNCLIDTHKILPKGIESNKYIAIHIRREDYYSRKDIMEFYFSKFSPVKYILLALQLIPTEYQNLPIFLFSDDKIWSKKITKILSESINKQITCLNRTNHFEDWAILRHASINICSNSTFSYTAALLNNENKDKKLRCVVPQWINRKETAFEKGWLEPKGFVEI